MLAKTKLAKLESDLNTLQARTRTRNLTLAEITEAIAQAEEAVKQVRAELRPAVTLEFNPHSVAKAYKDRAEGTALTVKFSKSGQAVEATVSRDVVGNETKNRLVLHHPAMEQFIADELGVTKPNWTDRTAYDKYQKLVTIVRRESGFNGQGTMLL